MSEKTDEKCYKSTPAKDLEDRIMNSNIAKSEAEWWAKGEIERLRGRLALLEGELKGLDAVQDLINNSYGVAGLHLNGDVAPWDELLEGGRFEAWLKDFSRCGKKVEVKG